MPSDIELVDVVIDEQAAPDPEPEPEPEPEQPLTQSEDTVPRTATTMRRRASISAPRDCAERDSICSIGWFYEGVGWMVPLFSDWRCSPV